SYQDDSGADRHPERNVAMRNTTVAFIAFVVLVTALGAVAIRTAVSQEPSFKPRRAREVPGEIIVKYKNAGFGKVAPQAVRSNVAEKFRLEPVADTPAFGIERFRISEERVKATLQALNADRETIDFATRNYIVYPDQVSAPNDPRWSDLWGLQKIDM